MADNAHYAALPSMSYQHATLQNGLQIYSIEDHSSPTVAVQVWYHVGSKDDPNLRSGFAHLFEHRPVIRGGAAKWQIFELE